jgi:hypothetical protein
MKEKFIEIKLSVGSLSIIQKVNEILVEYSHQGYRLSLRQVFYQLVARAIIENTLRSYKRIGDLLSNARLAGMIDWNIIEDRGRETVTPPMWEDPAEIIEASAAQFSIDRWREQESHVEVMVEKSALEGVLIPVCRELGIRFTANRGYSSSSTMYEAGKRLAHFVNQGKDVFILYLGDHDPSGIDMTRDVLDRLSLFSRREIVVKRLALNMDQIEQYDPPENPAKQTDSRFEAYVLQFGESSWELDALDPATLGDVVRTAVESLRDEDLWNEALEREAEMRGELQAFAKTYKKKHKGK